jgi:hypothetical protein
MDKPHRLTDSECYTLVQHCQNPLDSMITLTWWILLVPYDAVNRNKVSIRQLPLFYFTSHSLHVSAPTAHLQVRYKIRCFEMFLRIIFTTTDPLHVHNLTYRCICLYRWIDRSKILLCSTAGSRCFLFLFCFTTCLGLIGHHQVLKVGWRTLPRVSF